MEKSDAQLVSESILGHQGSFAELVRRHTGPIYSFCYRLVGNPHAAEDCTQETFIKVWKSLHRYKDEFSFRTWIFAIARNTTTDYLRKKKSTPFSFLRNDRESRYEDTIEDAGPGPEELAGITMNKESVETLLATMPENYRSVLVLHYQEDMTFLEISKVLDKPLNTVKSWHRRALAYLRDPESKTPLT